MPSISKPAFLKILQSSFTYSLSAKITCAFKVKLELKLPTGSSFMSPLSKTNFPGTISINVLSSGISMSFTWIIAEVTSFVDIPAYLSFVSFTIVFWTIVTYLPGIVVYAEFIFKFNSSSASLTVFDIAITSSSGLMIFPFLIPLHLQSVLQVTSIWLKLFTLPTTVLTRDVPISTPTMISPNCQGYSSIFQIKFFSL